MIKLYKGDCLEIMKEIQDESIDMILCDLPYEISACKWDKGIDLEKLWKEYDRIIKPDGAIVLFASQPFTSKLILSNIKEYKYNWTWIKDNATNFLNSHYQPMKKTEDICVFGKMAVSYSKRGNMKYYPQIEEGKPYQTTNDVERRTNAVIRSTIRNVITNNKGTRLPTNVLEFKRDKEKIHPTQKPVELLKYLIKTYTKENDTVLDNCMGSGSTGIACKETNRNFVGIEIDDSWYEIARERIGE